MRLQASLRPDSLHHGLAQPECRCHFAARPMRAAVLGFAERLANHAGLKVRSRSPRLTALVLRFQTCQPVLLKPPPPARNGRTGSSQFRLNLAVTLARCQSENQPRSEDIACRQSAGLSPPLEFCPLLIIDPKHLPIASHIRTAPTPTCWLRYDRDIILVADADTLDVPSVNFATRFCACRPKAKIVLVSGLQQAFRARDSGWSFLPPAVIWNELKLKLHQLLASDDPQPPTSRAVADRGHARISGPVPLRS
jgi:hypothetical protein